MPRIPSLIFAIVALLVVSSACSEEPLTFARPDGGDEQTTTVTWTADVRAIAEESCVSCHHDGGVAPFSMQTYDEASRFASVIAFMVEERLMPPWHAVSSDDCAPRHDFIADAQLTQEQVDTIVAWSEAGAPEGEPSDPIGMSGVGTGLSGVTNTLAPTQAYATSGDSDEFICFVLEPGNTEASWITGLQVRPTNVAVAHHAVIVVAPPAAAAEARDLAGEDGYYDCFGGVSMEGVFPIGVWVPGSDPFETPANIGMPVPANSAIIVQLHYHPLPGSVEEDATEIDLRMTTIQPERQFILTAVGNVGQAPVLQPGPNDGGEVQFLIPPDVADHVESMRFDLDLPTANRFPVVSVFPHMHYVGTKLEAKVERANPGPGEPAEECLVNVPAWDFEWQRTYMYDVDIENAPTIGTGDTVSIKCTYDNTLYNPYVQRALTELGLTTPIEVALGEETLDEMCLIGLGVVF